MKTDTELEALLRETFAGRADAVGHAPPWKAPARAAQPGRRWLPVLAAAVAVAIVAAGVVLGVGPTRSHRPVKPKPTPTPVPTACTTSLPAAWRAALAHAAVAAGGRSAGALSVAVDGSVIALRDDGVQPGDGREVVQLRPGSAPKVLYRIPGPDVLTADHAELIGHWLVVGLRRQPRPPKGTIPGSTPIGLDSVVVADVSTGRARVLATATERGRSINNVVAYRGKAYWDERPTFGTRTSVVKSYDPKTGRTRTVYTGLAGWPEVNGSGVVLFDAGKLGTVVAADLPAQVGRAVTSFSRKYLATDGVSYAWLVSSRVVGWWAPGRPTPSYVRLTRPLDTSNVQGALTVAGRFVLTEDRHLIDPVHDAVAQLPDRAFGRLREPSLFLAAAGVLGGSAVTQSRGHYIGGYWADAAGTPLRVDTRTLPALTC